MIDRFLRSREATRRVGAATSLGTVRRGGRSGCEAPAPILATYMARRPPVFVRNLGDARHINIAHGIYPRERLSLKALDRLAAALRETATTAHGRTYAGGLTKFEPRRWRDSRCRTSNSSQRDRRTAALDGGTTRS